jgi:hypothetical protein
MQSIYTYKDLEKPLDEGQELEDAISFFQSLELEEDGSNNNGLFTFNEIMDDILISNEITQEQVDNYCLIK